MYLVTGVLILFLLVAFSCAFTSFFEKQWMYAFLSVLAESAFWFLILIAIFLIGYQIYLL